MDGSRATLAGPALWLDIPKDRLEQPLRVDRLRALDEGSDRVRFRDEFRLVFSVLGGCSVALAGWLLARACRTGDQGQHSDCCPPLGLGHSFLSSAGSCAFRTRGEGLYPPGREKSSAAGGRAYRVPYFTRTARSATGRRACGSR